MSGWAELSSGLRALARLITAITVVTTYVALHLAINAGLDLRERDRFRDAPVQAAAYVTALDRHANADASARAEILAGDAWFRDNAPNVGSRTSISLATDSAESGEHSLARRFVDDLAVEIEEDQAKLDQEVSSSSAVALPWAVAAGVLIVLSMWLRHRRRTGVTEIVELVSRFVPHQPRWRRPVFMVVTGAGYVLLVSGFLAGIVSLRVGELPLEARGLTLLGCVVALAAGGLILRHSRPRSARGAVQLLLADGRKPVLYLRSFADDHVAAQVDPVPGGLQNAVLSIHSREEQLAGALSAFGPVIAVGKPGEPLPYLGAARFYLPHDDWQPGVLRLMELSQLIVLRLGPGEGLRWEVEQARATQPAHKLVLLVPGDSWTSEVVAFDSEWTPRVSPVGPTRGVKTPPGTPAHHVARAMQAALESAGVRKRAMVLRVNFGMLATFGKGLLLIPALVLLIRAMQLAGLW